MTRPSRQLPRRRSPAQDPGAQPQSQRQQQASHNQPEHAVTRDGVDADDRTGHHAGQGAQHKQTGQRPIKAAVPTITDQRSWGSDHVEQQICRGDSWARNIQHAQLHRQQEHRAGDTDRCGDRRNQQTDTESHQVGLPAHTVPTNAIGS